LEKFREWDLPSFRVSDDEIHAHANLLDSERRDIDFCQAQEQRNVITDFEVETIPAMHLGQKIITVEASWFSSRYLGGLLKGPSL
jgi:sulfopropanediol 3-dehydrogenase